MIGTIFSIAWKLAALVLAYNFLFLMVRPEAHLDFDAGTENRILAERYVYGAVPEAVMVGSSLTRALHDYLPPGLYDLAFSGGSPITGAEIALRNPAHPKVLVIETNVMERLRNQEMIDQIFNQPGFSIRRVLPGFRVEYRPLLLLGNTERLSAGPALGAQGPSRPASLEIGAPPSDKPDALDPRLAAGLALQMDYNAKFSELQRRRIAAAISDLHGRVDALKAQGVCVLLVRLPIQPPVDASPLEQFQAAAVRAAFPHARYSWLDIDNDGSYQTVDGLHLAELSARRVAWTIGKRVSDILRAGKCGAGSAADAARPPHPG